MRPKPAPDYLAGYPAKLAQQVRTLIEQELLAVRLLRKYPLPHAVRSAGQLSMVAFDGNLPVIRYALGTHTRISRVQGHKLKAKHPSQWRKLEFDLRADLCHLDASGRRLWPLVSR